MTRFSERIGVRPVRLDIQHKSMDQRLRNRLWNVVYRYVLIPGTATSAENQKCRRIYDEFLGLKHTHLPYLRDEFNTHIENQFGSWSWNEVYDFIEYCTGLTNLTHKSHRWQEIPISADFRSQCNAVLEQERSGYRFVGQHLTPITDPQEIETVESAASSNLGSEGASTHIRAALVHYADRDNPDFRNSVKESISAVEATAKWLAQDTNASCGVALAKIERNYGLHGALKSGFSSLYGWTSQDGGARHALMDRETITEADARYMLVSCSAFCNYLVSLKAHGPRAEA